MTVENIGTAAWVVQLTDKEAEQMGCRQGDAFGSRIADKAAELTGCEGHCTAQIYYGQGEMLLFLSERGREQAMMHFADLETLLAAAEFCREAEDTALYALDRGYILAFAGGNEPSPRVWDFGTAVPYSSIEGISPLIEKAAAPYLCKTFHL